MAPDCDYRLAEKRLIEVVNDVFAHYPDRIQREYHVLERELDVRVATPRPESRLRLGDLGIELVIRYPARLQDSVETADEIARRLVDAINRTPGLKFVAQGTPAIQRGSEMGAEMAPDISGSPPSSRPARQASAPEAAANPAAGAAALAAAAGIAAGDKLSEESQSQPDPPAPSNSSKS